MGRMALACVLCTIMSLASGEIVEVDLPLEHSLDKQTFSLAGRIQGTLNLDTGMAGKLTVLRKDLKGTEQTQLAQLIKSNGLYRLRLPSDPSNENSRKMLTSIPANCLIESNALSDHIIIHVTREGHFVGFNHDFSTHPCPGKHDEINLPSELEFPESSTVQVWFPAVAPILTKSEPLPGDQSKLKTKARRKTSSQTSSQVGGNENENKESEDEPDNRPWIVRNWMIAVPIGLVAFNILTAVAAPPDAQNQAPAGQRRR